MDRLALIPKFIVVDKVAAQRSLELISKSDGRAPQPDKYASVKIETVAEDANYDTSIAHI